MNKIRLTKHFRKYKKLIFLFLNLIELYSPVKLSERWLHVEYWCLKDWYMWQFDRYIRNADDKEIALSKFDISELFQGT